MTIPRSFPVLLIGWILATSQGGLSASQVNWKSIPGRDNFTSTAALLDSSFTFQLGAFANSFKPTADNTAEWAANWVSADTAVYNEPNRFFTASVVLPSNAPPFTTSNVGYIWGFNVSFGGGEWILVTNDSNYATADGDSTAGDDWKWPFVGGIPLPVTWSVSNATVVIVGTVEDPAGAHMITQAVSSGNPPLKMYEDWLAEHFSAAQIADPLVSAPGADPDGDDDPNVLEFALGTPPLMPTMDNRSVHGIEEIDGEYYMTLTVQRPENLGVQYRVEVTSDLDLWLYGSGHVTVMSATPTELMVRDNSAMSLMNRRFIRLNALLP